MNEKINNKKREILEVKQFLELKMWSTRDFVLKGQDDESNLKIK